MRPKTSIPTWRTLNKQFFFIRICLSVWINSIWTKSHETKTSRPIESPNVDPISVLFVLAFLFFMQTLIHNKIPDLWVFPSKLSTLLIDKHPPVSDDECRARVQEKSSPVFFVAPQMARRNEPNPYTKVPNGRRIADPTLKTLIHQRGAAVRFKRKWTAWSNWSLICLAKWVPSTSLLHSSEHFRRLGFSTHRCRTWNG